MRRWRGVLVRENEQTGDGRVIAPGAIEWSDLPLPLGWIIDGDQHVMPTSAPVIGNVDWIERVGNDIQGGGVIDDTPGSDGAEFIARLDAGTAPHGNQWFLSIDADNWEVQVIMTDPQEDDDVLLLLASAEGAWSPLRSVLAAAGDPDVEPPPESVLFEDSSGSIVERATRLRVRGVTACSVSAFDGALLELEPAEEPTATEPGEVPDTPAAAVVPAPVAASAAVDLTHPPAEWFSLPEPVMGDDRLVEQPDGTHAVPLTITDDGQVFGHVAAAGACHVGYLDQCVTAPSSSSGYAMFNLGAVHTREGTVAAVGPLVVNCDHAPLHASLIAARDHYANAGMGWADVHMVEGEFGPWFSGALRPGVTPEQIRVLRALSPSGDWRPDGRGGLELVATLAVNTPGFPISRGALAASGLNPAEAYTSPAVGLVAGGGVGAIVAAGIVTRCSDCVERARALAAAGRRDSDVLDRLDRIEALALKLAAPLLAEERESLVARIRR